MTPTPVRFPPEINNALATFARRADLPKSTVVVRAVDEWLRMQAHPMITFVATNTGQRRAALVCGPQVWVVAASWRQHPVADRSVVVVADALGLSAADTEAALAYWAAYRDEIDRLIHHHEQDQDAALHAWQQRQALRAV